MSYKIGIVRFLELILFLVIGLLITIYLDSNIYESFGIEFVGNLWVNWFGISFFVFSIYSIITRFFLKNLVIIDRLKSKLYWSFFAGSIIIVFIPFVLGKNPF